MRKIFLLALILALGFCPAVFAASGSAESPLVRLDSLPDLAQERVTNALAGNVLIGSPAKMTVEMRMTGDPAVDNSVIEVLPEAPMPKMIVGNKICPVSGEEIKPGSEAQYEYQGKVYNFCCPMCIEAFSQDPEKHIKNLETLEKAAAQKAKDAAASKPAAEKK